MSILYEPSAGLSKFHYCHKGRCTADGNNNYDCTDGDCRHCVFALVTNFRRCADRDVCTCAHSQNGCAHRLEEKDKCPVAPRWEEVNE